MRGSAIGPKEAFADFISDLDHVRPGIAIVKVQEELHAGGFDAPGHPDRIPEVTAALGG